MKIIIKVTFQDGSIAYLKKGGLTTQFPEYAQNYKTTGRAHAIARLYNENSGYNTEVLILKEDGTLKRTY